MKLETYLEATPRTLKRLESAPLDNFHMIMGMITELGELTDIHKKNIVYGKEIDRVNQIEEVGDFMWYFSNYLMINKIEIELMSRKIEELTANFSIQELIYNLNIHVAQLSSAELLSTKLPRTTSEASQKRALLAIINTLRLYCKTYQLDFEGCLFSNINKLYVRYPEQFSEDAALVRNLEEERRILEDGNGKK